LISCIFSLEDYPEIFQVKVYKGLINKLIDCKPVIKDTASLFNDYKSHYPFNSEKAYEALTLISKRDGRLLLYEGFFLWFSEYFELYYSTKVKLMNDNYFPLTWKYYLAIMAVSTMKCSYLLRKLEIDFLDSGGNEEWLEGLIKVPEKLRKIEIINNILAHQPWKLKVQDIKVKIDLIKEVLNGINSWKQDELVCAIMLLTNYHRLATIVQALRLGIDENLENHKVNLQIDDTKLLKEEIDKLKIISELEGINSGSDIESRTRLSDELTKNPSNEIAQVHPDFSKYISNFCTVYLDFDSHSEEYRSYMVSKL
jgi:hypothetical protein